MARYALKIRKSDIDLLTILNNGVAPEVSRKSQFLIVDTNPDGYNEIVTENELANKFDINSNGPTLLKLKA